MIIKGLFELIYSLLNIVLTPFQIIPDMPQVFVTTVNRFLDFIFAPVQIVGYFTDAGVVRSAVIIALVIVNMEHIWDGILWILKKLPFVGIE